MTKETILVAGATGTNGKELTRELLARGANVRALVRNADQATSALGSGVEVVQGDLADRSSLDAAFDGINKAFIVTAIVPNTLELFSNFFDAAKRAKVEHLVKFSGLTSSATSPSEVIRQHAESDDALKESGLTYTILRPNSFYQNMLWQGPAISQNDTFYLPLADARQSLIDVRDIAEIAATVLTTDGHANSAYDLTGPESLSFAEVANILGDVRGKPVTYVPISQEAAEAAMKEQGMPDWSARVLAEITAVFGTGVAAEVLADTERLLGRPPRTFRQFAEDYAAVFNA